jgi:hypothetical protein
MNHSNHFGCDRRFYSLSVEGQDQLVSLREDGKTWMEIGKSLGIDRRTAKRHYALLIAAKHPSNTVSTTNYSAVDNLNLANMGGGNRPAAGVHNNSYPSLQEVTTNGQQPLDHQQESLHLLHQDVPSSLMSSQHIIANETEDKSELEILRAAGKSWVDIGKALGIDRRTAQNRYKVLLDKDASTSTTSDKKRKVADNNDTGDKKTSVPLPEDIFKRTNKRRLDSVFVEVSAFWLSRKLNITEANRLKRVEWAREHLEWTRQQWHSVLWSEESPFVLRFLERAPKASHYGDGGLSANEESDLKIDHKIIVWGCFTAHGVGKLRLLDGVVRKVGYIDVLEDTMYPSAMSLFQHEKDFIFQENNNPKHTSYIAKQWHEDHGITRMPWPAQSPDLNPIDSLWSILDTHLKGRKPTTTLELYDELETFWNDLDVSLLTKLVDTMPDRCQAVIDADGYAINVVVM